MDLAAFYGAYRADGHGRAAYEPSMVVTLLMYAYATKQRSSRAIESHCRQDVAYRVITGNVVPDHATIARFVVRHEQALAGLFGEVLRLCDQAGLVAPGLVAIDGTRLAGNASREANREFAQIAREILAEAKATDEAEDELYGQARGDELPERLRTREGRAEFFRQAREERAAGSSDDQQRESAPELAAVTDPDTQRMKANNGNVQGTTPSPSWMRGRSCSPRSSLTDMESVLSRGVSWISRFRGSGFGGWGRLGGWRSGRLCATRGQTDIRGFGGAAGPWFVVGCRCLRSGVASPVGAGCS